MSDRVHPTASIHPFLVRSVYLRVPNCGAAASLHVAGNRVGRPDQILGASRRKSRTPSALLGCPLGIRPVRSQGDRSDGHSSALSPLILFHILLILEITSPQLVPYSRHLNCIECFSVFLITIIFLVTTKRLYHNFRKGSMKE